MAFSGHETFPVREGWLHKGLKLLIESPELLVDEYSHDWLGVGKNMSRSIKHWLVVTGLAAHASRKRNSPLSVTALGKLVWERDPYLIEPGTLWALHVNLTQPGSRAESWGWFFNHFNMIRFEKPVCVESLRRHLDAAGAKVPSLTTLGRDITCLLASYSRPIPTEETDPEDALECPFRELCLMSYFRASGYYQMHQGAKGVPPEIVAYALSAANDTKPGTEAETMTLTVMEAAALHGGPARAFLLTPEALFETVVQAEAELGAGQIQVSGLAGNRTVRVKCRPPIDWLSMYYGRLDGGNRNAA